jgi:hypothetical protein
MANKSADPLFQLIKSLEKSEKRNFKLFAGRNTLSENLKMVQLFDAIERMDQYDEALLLKRNKTIKKQQLSNLKAHLYKQILCSLRLIKDEGNIDIQLHEQMAHARILYNKGLYQQSLKVLHRMKEMSINYYHLSYLQQVLSFEKRIEALHITRSMKDRAEKLATEVDEVDRMVSRIDKLSSLALLLYSWYINNGHARNEKDENEITAFFVSRYPAKDSEETGFYERMYKYQCYCWYAFIRQDFLMFYRYSQKWVDLFEQNPYMLEVELAQYIKGLHNLVSAHFELENYSKFYETLSRFEKFSNSALAMNTVNSRVQTFVYLNLAKINKHFLEGTFSDGLKLVPQIEHKLNEYQLYLDQHQVLIFYYKFAALYFGSGDYTTAISYLNKIIVWKGSLRTDLQCYSRLLHLIAHYKLGNFDLMQYLIKSVYRFMAKMENRSIVEEEIFMFMQASFRTSIFSLREKFIEFLSRLKKLQGNRFEARAFSYLDIISWLESKITDVPVQDIIREKFLNNVKRKPTIQITVEPQEYLIQV